MSDWQQLLGPPSDSGTAADVRWTPAAVRIERDDGGWAVESPEDAVVQLSRHRRASGGLFRARIQDVLVVSLRGRGRHAGKRYELAAAVPSDSPLLRDLPWLETDVAPIDATDLESLLACLINGIGVPVARVTAGADLGPNTVPTTGLVYSEGLAAAELDGRWGYVDLEGVFVIPPRYADARRFHGGLAAVRLEPDGRWAWITPYGERAHPGTEVMAPARFWFGHALVRVPPDGERRWLGRDGEWRAPFPIRALRVFRKPAFIAVVLLIGGGLAAWMSAKSEGPPPREERAKPPPPPRCHANSSPQDCAAACEADSTECVSWGRRLLTGGDAASAKRAFDAGCTAGNDQACFLLYHHIDGERLEGTLEEALGELMRACELKPNPHCNTLASRYDEEPELEVAWTEAARATYHEHCLQPSSGYYCAYLGELYSDGRGVEQSSVRALEIFDFRCANDNEIACVSAGEIRAWGDPEVRDASAARANFETACDSGAESGCMMLGVMLSTGVDEVAADLERAAELVAPLCETYGAPRACAALEHVRNERQAACDAGDAASCEPL